MRVVGDRLGVYKSMLYKPAAAYTRSLDEALLATRVGGLARRRETAAGRH